MTEADGIKSSNRNRNFEDTHRLLIQQASEIITAQGAGAVSMAALARATGINRSTVYYHFDSRDGLLAAAQEWLSQQQVKVKGVDAHLSIWVGIDEISGFVQRNPDIIRVWIDEYIQDGNFRERYPQWDGLVAHIAQAFDELAPDESCDTAVHCALMLTSAVILPRLLTESALTPARLD
jgi:AcrR family transcriptional regulator